MRRIVEQADATARRLLTEHRDALERTARRLLERETMDRAEFEALVSSAPSVSPGPAEA